MQKSIELGIVILLVVFLIVLLVFAFVLFNAFLVWAVLKLAKTRLDLKVMKFSFKRCFQFSVMYFLAMLAIMVIGAILIFATLFFELPTAISIALVVVFALLMVVGSVYAYIKLLSLMFKISIWTSALVYLVQYILGSVLTYLIYSIIYLIFGIDVSN